MESNWNYGSFFHIEQFFSCSLFQSVKLLISIMWSWIMSIWLHRKLLSLINDKIVTISLTFNSILTRSVKFTQGIQYRMATHNTKKLYLMIHLIHGMKYESLKIIWSKAMWFEYHCQILRLEKDFSFYYYLLLNVLIVRLSCIIHFDVYNNNRIW